MAEDHQSKSSSLAQKVGWLMKDLHISHKQERIYTSVSFVASLLLGFLPFFLPFSL
jgi:hypothetical protein